MITFLDSQNSQPVKPATGDEVVVHAVAGRIFLWNQDGKLFWARGEGVRIVDGQSFVTPMLDLHQYQALLEQELQGYRFEAGRDFRFRIVRVPAAA